MIDPLDSREDGSVAIVNVMAPRHTHVRRRWLAPLLAAVGVTVAGAADSAEIIDVTDCNPGLIVAGEIGVLRNDIVCETTSINIGKNGKLDLAGHTITKIENLASNLPGWAQEHAVYCGKKCTIFSSATTPGRIVGPGGGVDDVIYGIEGGTYYDDTSCKRMRVENVEISGFDSGISAGDARLFLFDADLHDNLYAGALAERLTAKRVVADDNGHGVTASRIKLREFSCDGSNFRCVSGSWVKVREAVVTNSDTGIYGRHMRVIDSTVTSNVLDIASENFPRLEGTTCETSMQILVADPQPWGVCSLD